MCACVVICCLLLCAFFIFLFILSSLLLLLLFFFFFQAEDGIRDTSVTGVQTCALPISQRQTDELIARNVTSFADSRTLFIAVAAGSVLLALLLGFALSGSVIGRSEERRVGKECRSRWAGGA